MAVKIRTKKGKTVTLLNPAEKSRKYARELRTGTRITNDGTPKKSKLGVPLKLSPEGFGYRIGYINSRADNAKAFKAKRSKK